MDRAKIKVRARRDGLRSLMQKYVCLSSVCSLYYPAGTSLASEGENRDQREMRTHGAEWDTECPIGEWELERK